MQQHARAALLGDVVGSRSHPDRRQLQRTLGSALEAASFGARQPLTMTVGDEFQGVFDSLAAAIEADLLLRLTLAGSLEVRLGIGWGEVEEIDPGRTPYGQDGPGWWRAREALERLEEAERSYGAPTSWRTACVTGDRREPAIEGFLVLRSQLLAGLDETDATILRAMIEGESLRLAADRLGLNKSSVSRRARRHGLYALHAARPDLAWFDTVPPEPPT